MILIFYTVDNIEIIQVYYKTTMNLFVVCDTASKRFIELILFKTYFFNHITPINAVTSYQIIIEWVFFMSKVGAL